MTWIRGRRRDRQDRKLLSREGALRTSETIAALYHLISSGEHLVDSRDLRPGGLNDHHVLRPAAAVRSPQLRRVVELASRPDVTRSLHAGRLAAAVALLTPTSPRVRLAADAYLTTTSLLLSPRHNYGSDGSDHAAFVVNSASFLARAGSSRPPVVDAALWYIAAQSILSYGVSGVAKVLGSAWRDGSAVAGVMRTINYGDPWVHSILQRRPWLSRVLTTPVVAAETLFPLVLTPWGRRFAPQFVLAAGSFHVASARFMGLNRFLPAFAAMHPAVLYVTGPRTRITTSGARETRDDSMQSVILAVGIAGATWWAMAHGRRRLRVAEGRPDERVLVTGDGTSLRYRVARAGRPGAPVVIFEAGLASTGDHWEAVANRLDPDLRIVTYQRAGYGGSSPAPNPVSVESMVGHLLEVVAATAEGRSVVLVGHSLGGFLVWRAAARSAAVSRVVLVDPSHPDELRRGDVVAHNISETRPIEQAPALAPVEGPQEVAEQQSSDTAALLDKVLRIERRHMRMGLGILSEVPWWTRIAPTTVRGLIDDQLRDSRTWAAALREWRAARAEFTRSSLETIDVPALVITTDRTALDRPGQLVLHREMADAAPGGRHVVVAGCDHETVLFAARASEKVAEHISALAQQTVTRPEARHDRKPTPESVERRAPAAP